MKSHVVISHAREHDYMADYVSLPANYGTPQYFTRPDIRNIYELVYENLSLLDAKTGFTERLKDQKVLVKPNLVSVYHKIGFKDDDYPQSTDPRVLDAIIAFLKQYTDVIVIVESSGRGMPTRIAFRAAGIDRITDYHRISCVALEEQPVERYVLPKAQVMKEMLVPKILTEVIEGKSFYISVPKMKTNLYTGVTLGFKNAMGSIPYNLRQRDHNYNINKKLVDILYAYRPDLVIIDGVIGGEGNAPAPVDPVRSQMIVSGDNCVETDWVATELMGIDPETVPLMTEARARGFGADEVEVLGARKIVPFRKADPSLTGASFRSRFPNVRFFVGHQLPHSPDLSCYDDHPALPLEMVQEMEASCTGGCLAALRQGFEMFYYEGLDNSFHLAVIVGTGIELKGTGYYFSSDGKGYTREAIDALPMKKLAFGTCSGCMKKEADLYVPGCMPKPTAPMNAIHSLTGQPNMLYSSRNKQLLRYGHEALRMILIRLVMIAKGRWIDVRPSSSQDQPQPQDMPDIDGADRDKDCLHRPFPVMTLRDKIVFMKDILRHSL